MAIAAQNDTVSYLRDHATIKSTAEVVVPVNADGTPIGGAGATALGKAEDGAHTSGDVGIMDLGVRNDGAATSFGANNDYTPKSVDAYGRQYAISGGYSASATFTPAAASHTNGDVNGGAQEFALGAPSGAALRIVTATMLIAGGTIETTAWKLHLFNVTPPSALADDAAFLLASGDRASYLGFVDLAQVVDYGDSLYIEGNIGKQIKLSGTSVFGYLVNGTTLTPQAVAHTVTLHCEAV